MKKLKFFKFNIIVSIILSVVISIAISTWFSMHYMSHLYSLQSIDASSFMNVNKRIDLIDKKVKDRHKDNIKPVSL